MLWNRNRDSIELELHRLSKERRKMNRVKLQLEATVDEPEILPIRKSTTRFINNEISRYSDSRPMALKVDHRRARNRFFWLCLVAATLMFLIIKIVLT